MELRQLRHLLAICDTGTYARAAAELNTTQSSISKSVLGLEAELGAKLFTRGRFGAVPTEIGSALAVRARAMLAEQRLAIAEVDTIRGGSAGALRIGAGPALTYRVLPEAIAGFNARRPGVGITIVEGPTAQISDRLLAGELDFTISTPATGFVADPGLVASPLFVDVSHRDFIVVGAKHELAGDPDVAPAALSRYPWILSRTASHVMTRVEALFEEYGAPLPVRTVRTDSVALVKSLLALGRHIGILGPEFFSVEAAHGLLVRLPVAGFDWPRQAILLCRRRSPLSPVAKAFIHDLKAVIATQYDPVT